MRNLWQVYLDLINLEEEIDRLVLRKNRERLITEKERIGKEIDNMLGIHRTTVTDYLKRYAPEYLKK